MVLRSLSRPGDISVLFAQRCRPNVTSHPVGFYACFWGQKQLFKPHKRDPRKGRVDTQRSSGGFGPGQMGVLERESRTNLIKSSFSALTGIPVKTILILDFPFLLIFPPRSWTFTPIFFLLIICSILPFTCPTFLPLATFSLFSYFLSGDLTGVRGLKCARVSVCLTNKRLV